MDTVLKRTTGLPQLLRLKMAEIKNLATRLYEAEKTIRDAIQYLVEVSELDSAIMDDAEKAATTVMLLRKTLD